MAHIRGTDLLCYAAICSRLSVRLLRSYVCVMPIRTSAIMLSDWASFGEGKTRFSPLDVTADELIRAIAADWCYRGFYYMFFRERF